MFVKTLNPENYFSAEQLDGINTGIHLHITNAMTRDPYFKGINLGQVLFTNCITLKEEEVNAMVSFQYKFEDSLVSDFRVREVAIFDNDDEDGINYMLDHRKTKDEKVSPHPSADLGPIRKVDTSLPPKPEAFSEDPMLALVSTLQAEFHHIGGEYITGWTAIKILERVINDMK